MDYLLVKYGQKKIIDSKKFVLENTKEVIQDRREGRFTKEEAREIYDFLIDDCKNIVNEDELYFLHKENLNCLDTHSDYFFIYKKWPDKQKAFWKDLWKPFIDEISKEVE
ncbi:hypothetical protein MNB_SV-3-992 [hydrothermal vent metagenome]|uniref:Uncharacterized protein n=1 Tax=hydrothermal vent metagenome TaxID=652676 RepID=A0A1W1BXN0_9ZZZZ